MAQMQSESAIYKELNAEIRAGLKNIYEQISAASSNTNALFQEASDQLQEVLKATETAAMSIMDIVESQLQCAEQDAEQLAALEQKFPEEKALRILSEHNAHLNQSLTSVLTALSFQDITGQRLKKVSDALQCIEKSVVDLYLSSGLALEAAERDPRQDAKTIQQNAHKAVEEYRDQPSKLKGPDVNGCTQSAIDDMLAQLGL